MDLRRQRWGSFACSSTSCSAPPSGRRSRPTALFAGSLDDLRDGFIHLSTGQQVAATHARYFATETDVVVAVLDGDALGPALRWEASRGGARFPHLYRSVRRDEVLAARPAADDPLLH